MTSLFKLRPAERAPTAIAFGFLALLVASHALLETARDALFLAHVSATRLPIVYLAIAASSLLLARLESRYLRKLSARLSLVGWTAVSGLGTALFYVFLPEPSARHAGSLALYLLYVWSGLIAALVLVHFWSLLGAVLSVTQARRLYPLIGTGSVLGALIGSALASAIARVLGAELLLLTAAVGFGASTLVAGWFAHLTPSAPSQVPSDGARPAVEPAVEMQGVPAALRGDVDARVMEDVRRVASQPYVRCIALLVIVSAGSLTLADYVFKSVVARHVPAAELGVFFGGASLVLNILSLISQLTLSAWLLKRFAPAGLLAILPSLLAVGGVGLVLGFGLAAALFVKGSDGALRYSLHRTASELLYVPLPDHARPRIKAVLDMVAQRGGQALASLAILGLAAFDVARAGVALLLLVLSMVWAALAIELRRLYVDVLRDNLGDQPSLAAIVFPEFDMASLEMLVAALDSQDDQEVLAALTMLEREQKLHLVPTLILYHPSEQVVEHALEAFARAGRSDSVRVIDRLYEHASPRVRSAAVAARALLAPDGKQLFLRLSMEESPEVRATIVVHLVASGEIVGAEAGERLHQILEHGRPAAQAALARAMAWRSDRQFDPVLLQLTAASELEVRLAALSAIVRHPSPVFVPALIDALGDERTRAAARKALRRYDGAGLHALREALADESRPQLLRWELPRALASFEPEAAARALMAQLLVERDGMVRYRIIRALESVVAAHPTVALDEPALAGVTRGTITRAYRCLDERLALERGALEQPVRNTAGHELLLHVLRDKELHARDRLFRLLGLANPDADFPGIRRGLQSSAAKVRATSVELVATLLDEPVRSAVNGLIDDMPDADRLAWAGTFYEPQVRSYEEQLQHMLNDESASVQDVTAYHVSELGLSRLRPLIAAIAEAHPGRAELTRSLSRLPVLAGAHAQ